MNEPILCYVSGQWAYFTTQPLKDQWGDDWNDAPYEHNAGRPYEWRVSDRPPWEIIKVAFDGPCQTPAEINGGCNSPWSVEQINAGAVAWLQTDKWVPEEQKTIIPAGATMSEFRAAIKKSGGNVYELTT